jgi:hypothetical protein
MIELTRVQARFPEVGSIVVRAPTLRLNEIVLLQMKDGGQALMTINEGGLCWAEVDDLRAYVAGCRDALERSEALLDSLRRREPEAGTGDSGR